MMERYKLLLTYIKSAVTRNHSEKSINSILDYISTSKNVSYIAIIYICMFLISFKICVDGNFAKVLRNYVGCIEGR